MTDKIIWEIHKNTGNSNSFILHEASAPLIIDLRHRKSFGDLGCLQKLIRRKCPLSFSDLDFFFAQLKLRKCPLKDLAICGTLAWEINYSRA